MKKLGPSGFGGGGGGSDFSNLLAPWASGSRSLMLRAELASRPRLSETEQKWFVFGTLCGRWAILH